MPGPWRTSFVPYTKAVMDAFTDPDIEEIALMWGTQSAKTECINNMIGYAIDQDPGPMMIVYPEEGTAEFASLERLQPMFEATDNIRNKFRKRESERLELRFDDMYIALVGANSPSKLASRPIRYLLRDETAKYKKWARDEASPMKLSEERTKTFPHNKKIVDASTPKYDGDNIDKSFKKANVRYYYYVPCPHCGHKQRFRMGEKKQPGGIKWPEEIKNDPELALDEAWYECESCLGVIQDKHKLAMLRAGEWRPDRKPSGRIRSVAYHLNSIYSPFVTFGKVAKEFLVSKDEPADLMNFVNSWLAETWKETTVTLASDLIINERMAEHEEGTVPEDGFLLTMGVDVQLNHFIWTVRAWGEKLTSWNVAHGRVETFSDIEGILYNQWHCPVTGEIFYIQKCGMDSGYNTDDVYLFCTQHGGLVVPTKGSSQPLTSRYVISKIEKEQFAGMQLYRFDPDQYKNYLAGRISKPMGAGSWMVYKGCDRDYADQICAEQKQLIKGREVWSKVRSHAANHFLDAEVNAALAADLLGVRWLRKPEIIVNSQPDKAESGGWVNRRGNGWWGR